MQSTYELTQLANLITSLEILHEEWLQVGIPKPSLPHLQIFPHASVSRQINSLEQSRSSKSIKCPYHRIPSLVKMASPRGRSRKFRSWSQLAKVSALLDILLKVGVTNIVTTIMLAVLKKFSRSKIVVQVYLLGGSHVSSNS